MNMLQRRFASLMIVLVLVCVTTARQASSQRTGLINTNEKGDLPHVRVLFAAFANVNARAGICTAALIQASVIGHPMLTQAAPTSKAGSEHKGNNHSSLARKPVHAGSPPASVKEIQAKIVGAWARMYEGKVPRDEKGSMTGSILSFDGKNQITFRVEANSGSRFVMTQPMSYKIEKDSSSGLFVLSGDLGLKFAIVSIDANTLSIRYVDNDGKPADWVDKWQRISKDPITSTN